MRRAISLFAVLGLLLVPSAAHAERLSKRAAYLVTAQVVERRYQADPFAYKAGVFDCRRLSEAWVRCYGYIFSYRGGSNVQKHECVWPVFVALLRGEYLYRVGATHCYQL